MSGYLGQVLPVPHRLGFAGVVLQTTHHRHNVFLLKHNVEQRCLVYEEQRAEYVIEVVEAHGVLQVFTDVEEFEEFRDIVFSLHGLD